MKEVSLLKNKPVLGILPLIMICVAAVISQRGIVLMAEYGLFAISLYIIVALTFYIPTALISAELATAWPYEGGMYVWGKKAFGSRLGFFVMWMQWISRVVTYPVIFSFIAGTLAFVFKPSLASDKDFVLIVTLSLIWLITLMNLFGTRVSGWITTYSTLLGTFIPLIIVIVLGITWVVSGNALQIHFTPRGFWPAWQGFSSLSLLAGLYLMFAGADFCGMYANDVKRPEHNYPKAIFIAMLIIVGFCILATLSVAIVVPQKDLSLIAGLMQAFQVLLDHFHLAFLTPVIAILIAIAMIGAVNTLIYGTSKGLMATSNDGFLPAIFHKHNRFNAPSALLLTQAIVATLLSGVFIYMPTVNSSYWVVDDTASQIILIYYIIFFATWIGLRIKRPQRVRVYKVPGGNWAMWIIGIIGIGCCLFVLIVGFIPPDQFKTGSHLLFVGTLLTTTLVLCLIPFLIMFFRRRHFVDN